MIKDWLKKRQIRRQLRLWFKPRGIVKFQNGYIKWDNGNIKIMVKKG